MSITLDSSRLFATKLTFYFAIVKFFVRSADVFKSAISINFSYMPFSETLRSECWGTYPSKRVGAEL